MDHSPSIELELTAALATAKQHYRDGELQAVEAICLEILAIDPTQAAALHLLGINAHRVGMADLALDLLTQAIEQDPENPLYHRHLGQVYASLDQPKSTLLAYEKALSLGLSDPDLHTRLAHLLKDQGQIERAISHCHQALRLDPTWVEAHNDLGNARLELGQLSEALACYDRAIELNPDHSNAHWNRAVILLMQGDYQQGFIEAEWRWKLTTMQPRPFPQPLWDGSDLSGNRILLHAEQGMGDILQFIRYAPMVKARGGEVWFECPQSMLRLLSTAAGLDQLIAWGSPLPDFEVQVPLMSLPRILQTHWQTVPAQVPYLQASFPSPVEISSTQFKIGIVWAGSRKYEDNPYSCCSAPLQEFRSWSALPGIDWFSLQKGDPAQQLADVADLWFIQNLDPLLQDFADTAAVIDQLDLVISVDTSVAHLAGALAKPTWLLLPFAPDWRWRLDRDDSPWYPTLRLFRQPHPGDWRGVSLLVEEALAEIVPRR